MNARQFTKLCVRKYKGWGKEWGPLLWSVVTLSEKRKMTEEEFEAELPPFVWCALKFELPKRLVAAVIDRTRE